MGVDHVEAVMIEKSRKGSRRAGEGNRILRPGDDGVREIEPADFRLKFVAADVRVVRVDSRLAQRFHLSERRRRCAGPAIARREVEDLHDDLILSGAKDLKMRCSPATGDPSPSARLLMNYSRHPEARRRRRISKYATKYAT